jgi:hypothetical protein
VSLDNQSIGWEKKMQTGKKRQRKDIRHMKEGNLVVVWSTLCSLLYKTVLFVQLAAIPLVGVLFK